MTSVLIASLCVLAALSVFHRTINIVAHIDLRTVSCHPIWTVAFGTHLALSAAGTLLVMLYSWSLDARYATCGGVLLLVAFGILSLIERRTVLCERRRRKGMDHV